MLNRAYSLLEIKQVREDAREIEGIASTPSADRMGDVVEPMGAKFKLPMPLLWQHMSSQPVGHVTFAKPNKDGIPFKATIARELEPGRLKDRLDEAWQSVKQGLVRAVSIGFTINEYSVMEKGWRIKEWEWLELSLVTIPANAEATISAVKSIDAELLAASGLKQNGGRTVAAGVTASRTTHPPRIKNMPQTYAEQIAGYEATRAAKAARMEEMMKVSGEKGETLDPDSETEYDGLRDELKAIDKHLVRLTEAQSLNLHKAAPVVAAASPEAASVARAGYPIVQVKARAIPPGIPFTRYVMALVRAKGNIMQAHEIAKSNEQWRSESPEVEVCLKTAVAAGTTTDATWAGPLVQYQVLTSEFIEYLRPQTIIGRIPGLRRVPFKVKIQRQTGASTVNWVGEGRVKPISALAFDTITLDFAKIAGIVLLSDELVRLSEPSAEALVRDDLAKSIVQFMDSEFIDPTNASTDVSPAAITYNITPVTATGTTAAALRADVKTLFASFLDSNLSLGDAVWIMTSQTALGISMMTNSLGQADFPGVTMQGGTFVGLPVITSENIPATGGSPSDGFPMILAKASDILMADDGNVTIDASREASVQMDSTPDSPATASTVTVSLWQHNLVGIRAERYINWRLRRAESVGFIQNAKYADA